MLKPVQLRVCVGVTQVVEQIQDELRVDLVGVHVLQSVTCTAAEVIQLRAQIPACPGFPHDRLLVTTMTSYTRHLCQVHKSQCKKELKK